MKRCHGYSCPPSQPCTPKKRVTKTIYYKHNNKCYTYEIEEHEGCECACKLTQNDCYQNEYFDPNNCKCKCKVCTNTLNRSVTRRLFLKEFVLMELL